MSTPLEAQLLPSGAPMSAERLGVQSVPPARGITPAVFGGSLTNLFAGLLLLPLL